MIFPFFYYGLKRFLLATKHRFNGLFAYIIMSTVAFISTIIILMDVFKYGFNLGPARKKRQRLEEKYRTNYSKNHKSRNIRHHTYIITSTLQTISEEDEIQSWNPWSKDTILLSLATNFDLIIGFFLISFEILLNMHLSKTKQVYLFEFQ